MDKGLSMFFKEESQIHSRIQYKFLMKPVAVKLLTELPWVTWIQILFCFLLYMSDPNEPTTYELEQKSSVAGWEGVRNGMLTAVTELQAMPVSQTCLNCENTASLRCQRCGPFSFFCADCFQISHYRTNLFHVPEKGEVCIR